MRRGVGEGEEVGDRVRDGNLRPSVSLLKEAEKHQSRLNLVLEG